jgi:prepilin-type N-terminal cleavage/methylation domain-containing protein
MNRSRDSRGFTLVEVVLATALAATLMVAVLGVTASLGRSQRVFAKETAREPDRSATLDLLRRDLSQAQDAKLGNGLLDVIAYSALDPATLEPSQRPARVVYRVETHQAGSCLVREQVPLDQASAEPWKEVVAWGVTGLNAQAVRGGGAGSPGVPDSVQVDLQWQNGMFLSRVIHLK